MVQEVVALNSELEIFRFRHSEILEHSQVRVKVSGSVCNRQQGRAVLANRRRSRKTITVHVLMLSQMRGGIAGDDGIELHCVRAQDGLVVIWNSLLERVSNYAICSSREDRAVQVHIVIGTSVIPTTVSDVRATLDLGDTGDLPAAGNARQETV